MAEAAEELTTVLVAPWLATGDKPFEVTCRVVERTGKAVLTAGKIPLLPFNVGPAGVANCAGRGEGPKEAGAGIPTEVAVLVFAVVVPVDVPLLPVLPELLLLPMPLLIFSVTGDPDGIGELPPPPAHAAMLSAAAIPAMQEITRKLISPADSPARTSTSPETTRSARRNNGPSSYST